MSKQKYLMWCDLETSGSDEKADRVLEVAAFLTPLSGSHVIGEAQNWIVQQHDAGWLARVENNEPVRKTHTESGLINDVELSRHDRLAVENEWVQWLAKHGGPHEFVLAGSGVAHFDRRFIREWFPAVDRRLAYFSLDVGAVRRFLQFSGHEGMVPDFNTRKTHRAMDDLQMHWAEFCHYKDLLTNLEVASSASGIGPAIG